MKIVYPSGTRISWYDRNPSHKVLTYNDIISGVHGGTDRASVTLAAGRSAMVLWASVRYTPSSVTSPAGRFNVSLRVEQESITYSMTLITPNVMLPNIPCYVDTPLGINVKPGGSITISTSQTTDMTIGLFVQILYSEYDA